MSAIKCRHCGKTIATSKRAAFPIATEYANNTWQHNEPCEASATPIWTMGQRVTVERLFSGAERYVMAPAESRMIASVTVRGIVLDDGTTWDTDGRRSRRVVGDHGTGKVRPELPGDAVEIERRRLIFKIVSTRGDAWGEVPLPVLRVICQAIEVVEAGRAALVASDTTKGQAVARR